MSLHPASMARPIRHSRLRFPEAGKTNRRCSDPDEISFETQFGLCGPTSIGCDKYTGLFLNSGSDYQGVRQIELLAVTGSQSRCHNGDFNIKFSHHEWKTLDELSNRHDRRLAIACRGHKGLSKC